MLMSDFRKDFLAPKAPPWVTRWLSKEGHVGPAMSGLHSVAPLPEPSSFVVFPGLSKLCLEGPTFFSRSFGFRVRV